jgi:hypothetical protein
MFQHIRNAKYLTEGGFTCYIYSKNARNALHGHEHMRHRNEARTRSDAADVVRISFAASCMRCQSFSLVSTSVRFHEKMLFTLQSLTPESNFEICGIHLTDWPSN